MWNRTLCPIEADIDVVNYMFLFLRRQGESRDLRSIWEHLPHPERLPQDNVEPAAVSFFFCCFFFLKCHFNIDLYMWITVRAVIQGCECHFLKISPPDFNLKNVFLNFFSLWILFAHVVYFKTTISFSGFICSSRSHSHPWLYIRL